MYIAYSLKYECVQALQSGKNSKEVYNEIFAPQHPTMSYETFRHKIRNWSLGTLADPATKESGTYPGMTAYGATVQVNANGEISQAWIRQLSTVNWDVIISQFRDNAQVSKIEPSSTSGSSMLEIPMFDMHFGVAKLDDYKEACSELLEIINSKKYEEIHIIFGQDVLHTNDMRGHTAKGTDIGKIDFVAAWNDAWTFWRNVIDAAISQTPKVVIHYSKGNHDECTSWCLLEALKAVYPQCEFDDEIIPRKCIFWKGCFIGFGHCEYSQNSDKLFRDFVVEFPNEFANASVREIHAGHLHYESSDNGLMVRRLASAVPVDDWSRDKGFIGVHKRFQVFEYIPKRLRSIMYI